MMNKNETITVDKMGNEKLPFKVKLGYGTAGYAGMFTFTMIATYGLYFFTDVVGFTAAFAGTLISIGTLWDAISDPLVGSISDKRDPKKGRRRPFLLYDAIPFGIVSWLLFTDWGFDGVWQKVYFVAIILCWYTVQTCLDVPYTALGSEMTRDYDERSSLSSIRSFTNNLASLVGSFTLSIVAVFTAMLGSEQKGWSVANLIFAVVSVITILITWRATKGWESTEAADVEKFSLIRMFKAPFSNKAFRHITVGFAASIIAMTIGGSIIVYYMSYNMQMTDGQISTAMAAMWITCCIWVPVTNWLSQKFSKKVAWIVVMSVWAGTLMIFINFINNPEHVITVYIMVCIYIIGVNGLYQITWASIPDCVEVDEFKTGQRKEGNYYAIASFFQKCGAAIAIFVSGHLLTWIGYDPSLAVQSAETLAGIQYLYAFGPPACLVVAIIAYATSPMTKERHAKLREAIELKKQGKEYSTEGFKELL